MGSYYFTEISLCSPHNCHFKILNVRAVQIEYEFSHMRQSGRIHQRVIEELVPGMLREWIAQLDFYLT